MARKRGVVDYEGAQVLMQGEDDGVIIRLLKDKIEDSSVTMYLAKSPLKEMKKRKVRTGCCCYSTLKFLQFSNLFMWTLKAPPSAPFVARLYIP